MSSLEASINISRDMCVDKHNGTGSHDSVKQCLASIRAHGRLPQGEDASILRGAHLIGEDLSGLDLSGLDLSGADLSRANLSRSRLVAAKLRGTILFEADLSACELLSADLGEANLSSCSAEKAGFESANLTDANLFNADLKGVALTKAVLCGADMRRAELTGARIRDADLTETDLSRSNLKNVDLEGCNVDKATFVDAELCHARLRGLRGYVTANWIGTDVHGVNFTGAYLTRRTIMDQNFLHEFRAQSRANAFMYWLWWLTSDCGRSFARWGACIFLLMSLFAVLFTFVSVDYGENQTAMSPLYFSVVTLTTLGYGDVIPVSMVAQMLAMIEVVIGYVMLGGLLSIFANKMSRRAD